MAPPEREPRGEVSAASYLRSALYLIVFGGAAIATTFNNVERGVSLTDESVIFGGTVALAAFGAGAMEWERHRRMKDKEQT